MRVAQVLPAFFDDRLDFMGGGDRYVHKLAQALRPYCDVTFFTFGARYRDESLDGVRHVVLPSLSASDRDNPIPRSLAFASNRFDIVHSYHLRTAVTSLAIMLRAGRQPLVVTDLGGGGRSPTLRLKLYRFIKRFICISEFSRSLLPPDVRSRAIVIKGGIDLERFPFDPQARQRQVLQVSRIMPHKGQNYLVAAAGQDIPVVIAGKIVSQSYFRELQRLAEGKPVRFLIDADDDAVLAEYRRSTVTVQPSVYRDMYGGYWPTSELLGLPLLESMSVGTPVICTNVGGMPEYVRDGATGFVIPPNDPVALRRAILQLVEDPARAARMGLAGRQDVLRFGWDVVAQQVFDVYSRLLSQS